MVKRPQRDIIQKKKRVHPPKVSDLFSDMTDCLDASHLPELECLLKILSSESFGGFFFSLASFSPVRFLVFLGAIMRVRVSYLITQSS